MSEWKDEHRREQEEQQRHTDAEDLDERLEAVVCAANFMVHATQDPHISAHWPSTQAAWDHLAGCVSKLGASVSAKEEIMVGEHKWNGPQTG